MGKNNTAIDIIKVNMLRFVTYLYISTIYLEHKLDYKRRIGLYSHFNHSTHLAD